VEADATVTAYVVPPLCAGAEQQLQAAGGRAGGVRVKAVCLPSIEPNGQLDLAAVGADARRATEDSTTVAYLEPPGRAGDFSRSILEAAEVPWISGSSGKAAMTQFLRAIDRADSSGSLRASVSDQLR
jgi:hypothetical protein